MAQYDKYDPEGGGFRALLAADWAAADGVPLGVGLDVNGRIVPGAGNSGVLGIVVLRDGMNNVSKKAGMVADVMVNGEIVEVTGLVAGSKVYANTTTGVLTNVVTGSVQVGFTIESDRVFVMAGRG